MPWDKKRLKGEWEDRAKRSRYSSHLSLAREVFSSPSSLPHRAYFPPSARLLSFFLCLGRNWILRLMDFSRFYHETVVAWYSGNEVDAANVDVSSLILPSLPFSLIFHPRLNRVNSRGEIFPHIYKLSIGSECTANTNFSVELAPSKSG